MKKLSIAGIALSALPLLAGAQTSAVDMEAMAQRQQELEKLVRDQGARIAELERLLKIQPSTPASAGAAPRTEPAGVVASTPEPAPAAAAVTPDDEPAAESGGPEYIPNAGFKIYESDKAQIIDALRRHQRAVTDEAIVQAYIDFQIAKSRRE